MVVIGAIVGKQVPKRLVAHKNAILTPQLMWAKPYRISARRGEINWRTITTVFGAVQISSTGYFIQYFPQECWR